MNPFIPTSSSLDPGLNLAQLDQGTSGGESLGDLMAELRAKGLTPGEVPSVTPKAEPMSSLASAGTLAGAQMLSGLGQNLAAQAQQRQRFRGEAIAESGIAKQKASQQMGARNFKALADLIANYRSAL